MASKLLSIAGGTVIAGIVWGIPIGVPTVLGIMGGRPLKIPNIEIKGTPKQIIEQLTALSNNEELIKEMKLNAEQISGLKAFVAEAERNPVGTEIAIRNMQETVAKHQR